MVKSIMKYPCNPQWQSQAGSENLIRADLSFTPLDRGSIGYFCKLVCPFISLTARLLLDRYPDILLRWLDTSSHLAHFEVSITSLKEWVARHISGVSFR